MNTINYLLDKISNSKQLDFGTVFSNSFELFKKTWIQGFLMKLMTVLITLPLIIILYIPLIFLFIAQVNEGDYNPEIFSAFFAGFSIIYIIFIFVGVFVLGAISMAINAGFYRIMMLLDKNKQVRMSDLFYFVKSKYLGKLLVLLIISIIISVIATLLCVLPVFYVMVPISFFTVVFAFNPDLSAGDIITVSFKLGNKKWLITFGLLIISSILTSITVTITCGLAALFVSAFIYHPTYLVYKEVIGFNDESDLVKIDVQY